MTPEEQSRLNELCQLIKDEKDNDKFHRLLKELNELLSRKGRRLEEQSKKS